MSVCACVRWPFGKQARRRRPRDDALEAAEALHHGADVDAERQRVVARQLELVQERHVEVALIAEAAAARDVAPLIQVARRRPVRVVVVFAEHRDVLLRRPAAEHHRAAGQPRGERRLEAGVERPVLVRAAVDQPLAEDRVLRLRSGCRP